MKEKQQFQAKMATVLKDAAIPPRPVGWVEPNTHQTHSSRSTASGLWRWSEAFNVAIGAILANRLRSILTIIGIVIGVAVVALVAAMLEGAQKFISREAQTLGPGIVVVDKVSFLDFIGDGDAFIEAAAKRPDITIETMQTLRDRVGDRLEIGAQVDAVLPVQRAGKSLRGIAVQGVTPNIVTLSTNKLDAGRELTDFDNEYRRFVCVIGADVVDDLFPYSDPIGQQLKLGSASYEVVGVYAKRGSTAGASQDGFVQIPLSTYAKVFGARSRSIALLAKAKPGVQMTTDEVEDLTRFGMRQVRRLQPGVDDNFSIKTAKSIEKFAGNVTNIVGFVLFPLTGIALAVGGIVVMNMMLASVTERTREIGIRMAIGARRRDILAQFLLESTLLTLLGGAIGVGIAAMIAWTAARLTDLPVTLPLWALAAAVIMSFTVGIVFGVFPARRASKLDPIEALRTE
ncbi:MAG TPA: ABC transporter permease [Blastocatellia bacterium]|nr:ABC transporter permease [Blastocatellia bacterium]